ncbi:hypothetical protein [Candidatus Binatus sp.]|jgi:hypothetical protein|uniref:hypothetical protein n=1 Tax=Candidatus Binatus sp. TaxID=2811406 RepID=UPI003BDC5D25
MRFNKLFTRSIASLSFSLLFLIAVFARPALAQSDNDASPDKTKAPVSKLSVSPTTLSYSVNLDKATTETKHFTITDTGTLALDVTVNPPTSPDYVITSGGGSSTIPGKAKGVKNSLTVEVEFTPTGKGTDDGTIGITSKATSGKSAATVNLKGKATQKKPTPTATATATATATPTATATATATATPTATATATATGAPSSTATGVTPTATPTATPTPAACPSASPGACPSAGASPSISSLIPSSAVAGGPGVALAVCGCNLTASTAVQWNTVGQTTSFVSSNQLNASIPATDVANVGVDLVTVSAASEVSAPETFFVGSTGGAEYAELEIDQQSTDIVNDPVNQVIYLSVPGAAPTNANTISVLSLASGQITSSPYAGSNPDVLAISDDSQYLYAGIDGAALVQRFTLPNPTMDINYSLGRSSLFGPYYALDLQVAPGAPHTTAVTLAVTGESPAADGGVVIFDDSTARPTIAKGFGPGGGGGVLYDSLQWGSDATALYAANNEDTGFDFYVLSVDSAGVTLVDDYSGTFSEFGARIHFDSGTGLIYSDDGHVVAPSTGNPAGEYSASIDSVMVPDSTLNKVFFVSSSGTIQSFNQQEFSPIGSITIPGVSSYPLRIIRWGNNGLAFNTSGGPVYLIGCNFVH